MMGKELKKIEKLIQRLLLNLIKTYQIMISPFLGQRCRFYPSCSEYFKMSVAKYGINKGILLGAKRIFRCHPKDPGGVDLPR